MLVARRFAFFDFNLKAEALILATLVSPARQQKVRKRGSLSHHIFDSLPQIIPDDPRQCWAWTTEITRDDYIACHSKWRRVIHDP
jgi:hypothetical protein